MQSIELRYNGISDAISFPSTWNELTLPHLYFIAQNWQRWTQLSREGRSLIIAKAKIFLHLIDERSKTNNVRFEALKKLNGSQLYDVANTVNFIFEEKPVTKCPLPVVSVGLTKFYAPNDGMSNITAEEFAFADYNYLQYYTHNRSFDLDLLIATIYRPFNPEFKTTGVKRVPFRNAMIEAYAAKLKKLHEDQKQLILLWYIGCRMAIQEKYTSVFSSDNEQQAQKSGWMSIIMALSGNRFGPFQQTAATDLHLVLSELINLDKNARKNNQNA